MPPRRDIGRRALDIIAESRDLGETTARLAAALSAVAPRCLVTIGLASGVGAFARAGRPTRLESQERLQRLVSTGKLPIDPLQVPEAHRNRWVEPLAGFLDPVRYAASPVGTLMAAQGWAYFARHMVCDGTRLVAMVGAWLPVGAPRFSNREKRSLSAAATRLGPILRMLDLANQGATYQTVTMREFDGRGEAAFVLNRSGAVLAMSTDAARRVKARPELRMRLEKLAAALGDAPELERAWPALGLRARATALPTPQARHVLVTVATTAGDAPGGLTARQRELLDYLEIGLSNRDIGLAMGLSSATVKTMLQRLYARTGTASRLELVRWRRAPAR